MNPIEVFARGAWKCIPNQEDISWIGRTAATAGSNAPLGDFGPIIKEMLEKGISPVTIARFAKIIGYEAAFKLCYYLEDPQISFDSTPEIAWGLFQVDPNTDQPIETMFGIHEVMLEMDPSGCEMRPKIGE